MAIPFILIAGGTYWLFYNTGWTFNFVFDIRQFWPLVMILLGLVIMLKSPHKTTKL
ncbi:MAG: DUF5668 domain-containing protein [Candidatus Paceibacterota bacterium]|jgi:hypothetical protein